jgi:hypothetical protein
MSSHRRHIVVIFIFIFLLVGIEISLSAAICRTFYSVSGDHHISK